MSFLDAVAIAELEFTSCFNGICQKFDLYEFDQSHRIEIHRSQKLNSGKDLRWIVLTDNNPWILSKGRNWHSILTLQIIHVVIDTILTTVFMMLFMILNLERFTLINQL